MEFWGKSGKLAVLHVYDPKLRKNSSRSFEGERGKIEGLVEREILLLPIYPFLFPLIENRKRKKYREILVVKGEKKTSKCVTLSRDLKTHFLHVLR